MSVRTRLIATLLLTPLAACQESPIPSAQVPTQALAAIVASFSQVNGAVEVRRPGMTYWEDARTGTVLRRGDWIRTGPSGSARVGFLKGGKLRVAPESLMIVEVGALTGGNTADEEVLAAPVLALSGGEVTGELDRTESGERAILLRGQDGGTLKLEQLSEQSVEFRLLQRMDSLSVSLLEGSAKLGAPGWDVALTAGEATTVREGKAASVERLFAAPESLEPSSSSTLPFKPGDAVKLRWSAVARASGYRLEIARTASFEELLTIAEVRESTTFSFLPEAKGTYFWRLATRDEEGRLGQFGPAQTLSFGDPPEARGPPELLVSPAPRARLEGRSVRFSWTEHADKRGYRLVIATSAALLETAVAQHRVTGTGLTVRLRPGSYHWGVYTDEEPPKPLFSAPRGFRLRAAAKPSLAAPRKLTW